MDNDGRDADLLERAREARRRELRLVPAKPHLDSDGKLHRLDDGAYGLNRAIDIAHHRRAAAAFCDLVDRATHVDVDRADAVVFKPARSICHLLGVRAVNLDRHRSIVRGSSDQLHRLAIRQHESPGVDQIGRRQPEPTQFADRSAKR